MSLTQNNFDYAHYGHRNQLRLHSLHLHTKQNYAYTHVTHSTYKTIFPANNRIETI